MVSCYSILRPAAILRWRCLVDCVWNVMAHAQKPDLVFRRNGRVHFNRRGASVQSTPGSPDVRISGSNAGYTTFRGSVKSTGYPLHSLVSPSLPFPWVTVCHQVLMHSIMVLTEKVVLNLKIVHGDNTREELLFKWPKYIRFDFMSCLLRELCFTLLWYWYIC